MVELTLVAGGKHLDAIAHELAVKPHEKAAKRQVVRGDEALEDVGVGIAEGGELRGLQPLVPVVDRDQSVVLIRVVKLL